LPGSHSVGEQNAPYPSVTLKTEAGNNYFVRVSSKGGWVRAATYTVEVVGDEEGRNLVRKARLASNLTGL